VSSPADGGRGQPPTWLYDGRGTRSKPWWPSPYGPDDQLGAAAEVTPEKVLRALKLPATGRVIALGRVLEPGMPGDPNRSYHSTILAHNVLEQRWTGLGGDDVSSFEEHAEHSYHVGTHLDGLAHVGIGDRFYNGTKYEDMFGIRGLRRLGAHNIPPLLTRGLLVDVAGLAGRKHLPEGFVIEIEHIENALEKHGLMVEPGDAVLIHTGWGQLWFADPAAYSHGEPGIGEEAGIWLARQRPCLIGADSMAVEVVPNPNPERPYVVHQHLITVSGIYLLENLDLSELAAAGAGKFLFALSPVIARGATGALAGPSAVL
jgi:kynurenine formamidase